MDTARPSGCCLSAPVAVVVAHPDDETLSLGGQLAGFEALSLIHVTDGSPHDLTDAHRAGLRSRDEYARARAHELDLALAAVQATPARRETLGVTDQEAVYHLRQLTELVAARIAGAATVITHPYEGGHPDHDACAFILQAACEQLRRGGVPVPARLEFASYHAGSLGRIAAGVFWPERECPEMTIALNAQQLARKKLGVAQFVTQLAVIGDFPLELERLRPAPDYDFTQLPPPRNVLYDGYGWRINSLQWRENARRALVGLGLDGPGRSRSRPRAHSTADSTVR